MSKPVREGAPTKVRRMAERYMGEAVNCGVPDLIAFGLKVWAEARRLTKRELQPRKWYLRPTQVRNIRRAGH